MQKKQKIIMQRRKDDTEKNKQKFFQTMDNSLNAILS